ncbi:uncharacterized protein [Littorina saxatilis]|uniref:VWFA domain-containing protein n=1 Tax=Littorina saxatilis TaxID=31220 RepID=A0AAN9BCH3_9CAEN
METAQNMTQPPLAKHDSRLLDLAFAMDTTGSMGSYINSARDNIRRIVEDIVAKESSDVRLALVEYRDHPPQDRSYVTQKHDFTPRVGEMKKWLDQSRADGGGDAPEAVADALYDVLNLSWRKEATKICVLISDAPPHGLQPSGDGFPNGCPAGHDPMNIARQLAENSVTLYVAGCEPALIHYKDFFSALAYVTGGQYVPLSAAGSLTAVIVGGAQEELSLEQWMDQVNQQVVQEVQQQGEANVDVEELSRQVMGRLNMAGHRSKHLRVNNAEAAPTSDHVKKMSSLSSMEAVRAEWKPTPSSYGGEVGDARFRSAPMMPMMMEDDCDDDEIALSSPAPPEAVCSLFGSRSGSAGDRAMKKSRSCAAAPPPPPMGAMPMRGGCAPPPPPMGAMPMRRGCAPPPPAPVDSYATEEGEIQMAQAERMVQKALMRNNINLQQK